MNYFSVKKEKTPFLTYVPMILLIMVLGFFVLFSNSFSQANLDHEKQLLEQALDRSITQCYALEGTYPPNLDHLKEHYGLTYNEEHFFVDYQYIGGNLRPDVTIITRD